MRQISVLVTGSGGGSIGEQLIKALKLEGDRYNIISSDSKGLSVGRHIANSFVKVPLANDKNYLRTLIEICNKHKVDVLIPGSEPELLKIANSIDLFEDLGIYVPINSLELISLCSDKLKFNDFLAQNGFKYPWTGLIDQGSELTKFQDFPYVLKPLTGSGSTGVFIVQNSKELRNIVMYLGSEKIQILQEYVGTLDAEYTVGILSTPTKGYIDHIVLRRDLDFGLSIKQKVHNKTKKNYLGTYLGISTGVSQGTFVANNVIDDLVHKLVSVLSPESSINIQCRLHQDNAYVFEINPRFSGTTHLRALVGFNEPDYIIKDHFNLEVQDLDSSNWINRSVIRGLIEYTN